MVQYGYYPADASGGLVKGDDGDFYGTRQDNDQVAGVVGSVFRITPGGTLTTIYTFPPSAVGGAPITQLVKGPGGAFYGMTYGTVYKITPQGKLTTLHVFDYATDGDWPGGPLLLGRHGLFYGTTGYGGPRGGGTIFSITADGKYRRLYGLAGPIAPPLNPPGGSVGELIQDSAGNLYGETQGMD